LTTFFPKAQVSIFKTDLNPELLSQERTSKVSYRVSPITPLNIKYEKIYSVRDHEHGLLFS